MKLPFKNWDKKQWFRFIILMIVSIVIIGWVIYLTFLILKLNNEETRALFEQTMSSLGIWGWLIILAIQIFQIVLAFVPGGPIQVIAGSLYGPIGGTTVTLLGTVIASFIIFKLTHKFGPKIVELFVGGKDINSYKFIQNEERLNRLVFFLFLIPGTPKDALTYLVALTKMSLKTFLMLTITARAPGVLTSVLAGKYIIEGNWLPAVVCFLVMGAFSVVGLLLYKRFTDKKKKKQI